MAIIGIDLGTTNSLACVYRDGRAELIPNELGDHKTPSAVSVLEDGTVLVGAAAKERLISHPEATAASFKIWMGMEKALTLAGRRFKPEELSALVLRQLLEDAKRYLGEPVEEAVISVPAYFNDDQRCATKLAAQLAGLTVKRLINEPSAAALYHRYSAQTGDCQLMIVDFGGGTLDVSIVECFENIIEITAIAGDNRLGGDDIDRAIAAHFCQENGLTEERLSPSLRASLYRQAETAKIALSSAPAASISLQQGETRYSLLLTNDLLRQLCGPVFQKVRAVITRAMKDRGRGGRLNDVILVGGSAQLTVFGDFLEELFGRRPHVAASPDEIVALGVGLCAGIKERAEDLQDLVMTDVCPFSLGVSTYSRRDDKTPHMAVLIPRSSMLPASHQERFYTLNDNQTGLRFEIYQGEGYFASENLKLGEVEVQVPPGPAGEQSAVVSFTYDIDGILHVSAQSSGGDFRERLILNPNLHLTEEGRERAMERIRQIQLAAQGDQRDQLLLERALRLYTQTIGQGREMAASLIGYWKNLMDRGDRIQRRRDYDRIKEQLDMLEAAVEADPLEGGIWFGESEEEDFGQYFEGGGKLYTAEWFEDAGGVTICRQTFSGRRVQEQLLPDPDGSWTAAPGSVKRTPNHEKDFPPIRFTADSGFEAARRRLAELTDPRFFDLSRLRELPWKIFYTPVGGVEESLSHIDVLREPPKVNAEAFLAEWEEAEEIPPDMEPIIAKVRQAVEEQPKEEEPIPPEILVTGEALSALLYRFSQDELERLEMEWMEGRLVLRRDGDKYACLYFENSFGRGENWYALLADAETYKTVDCGDVAYVPFGMGKLAEYSIFHSALDLLRDMDLVLGQMGWGQLQAGGPGGWLWSCDVSRHDPKHKVLMTQQKLGGVPAMRGRNYNLAKFVLSRPASELETVDLGGERTVTALRSGSYGLAAEGLIHFMMGKLASVRVSWTFRPAEGETELRHLVLLQDQGNYMMLWLEDGARRALAYASDEPRRFMGRVLPACLVHEDLKRLRNGVDLLLDDIDNTGPVLGQPGQFAEVRMPYEELRAALVHET